MAPQILRRNSSSANDPDSGTVTGYIAGLVIAGTILLGVLIFLFLRSQRSRVSRRRSDNRGAAFLHVRGVVRPIMAETVPPSSSAPPPFSRDMLTSSVVMPEKALTRKPAPNSSPTRITIVSPPASASSSSRRPRSTMSPTSPRARPMSILNPAHPRHSRSSSSFSGHSQFRLPPGLHSRESSLSSSSSSQSRPVRQLFEPLLPDELHLSRYGEYLTVLQSFDDGWCLVSRDTSRYSRASMFSPTRMSSRTKGDSEHIELGLVPAWVFVKPLKGLSVTRPMRSASVDALQTTQDVPLTRETVVSWSHLA